MAKRPVNLDEYIRQQRWWIERCGGNLSGYILKYGSANDPDHSGDGGEAIYEADIAALRRLEAMR